MSIQARIKQEQGQKHYREKNYKEALKCFNSLLSDTAAPSLSVLDNRAATYVKLQDLPKALADGKKVIHVAKNEASGYLRTGQILQKMFKDETALEIYKYGLKNVPLGNKDRELLESMYGQLGSKMAPAKAIDPLKILPMEIAEMVIQHLEFNNIVVLLTVSKRWKELLEGMSPLWWHLNLSKAKSLVRIVAIKACMKRTKGNLTRATLSRLEMKSSFDPLHYLVSRSPRLERLDLLDGIASASLIKAVWAAPKLKTLILSASKDSAAREITLDAVTELLNGCTTLEHAEFRSITTSRYEAVWISEMPNLKRLTLNLSRAGVSAGMRLLNLSTLFSKAPNITHLTLRGWMILTRLGSTASFHLLPELTHLDLDRSQIVPFPVLPSKIQHLSLHGFNPALYRTDESQINLQATVLPHLTSFSSFSAHHLWADQLQSLLGPNKDNIKRLYIPQFLAGLNSNRHRPQQTQIIRELLEGGYFSSVVELNLRESFLHDAVMELFAEYCPSLTHLDASYNSRLTGVGVKALVLKKGSKLESLNLQHCEGVGYDAVQWAKSTGVNVKFDFPDESKGAKKVRWV